MIQEQKQSTLFNIASKAIVKSVLDNLVKDFSYIEGKAKQLCYCTNQTKRDTIINSIYNRCELDIFISNPTHLSQVLNNLKTHVAYVCDSEEFWRLYNSLTRFTHCNSFFSVCNPTIIATLATLVTIILSNKLIYAAEMIESIETYLFETQKPFSQELVDLLDMKYGLVNLVQYRILPTLLGKSESVIAGSRSSADLIFDYQKEADQLLKLPVKCSSVSDVYSFLISNGINTANNLAEYSAGLKIQDITNEAITKSNDNKPIKISKEKLAECSKVLENAKQYFKGYTLDGAVTSPLTDQSISNFIPLSSSDINKFTILEYLYVMRVMANCIKRKNGTSKSQGVTLNINSPFKVISVPGKC